MATGDRTFEVTLDCPRDKAINKSSLRYLGIAATVALPKAFLLGRAVIRFSKPPATQGSEALMLRAGSGGGKPAARRRGGKKK